MDTNFPGYNSANDPTKIDPSIMVGGSLNVYKKINGNIANRPGKKLYTPADTTSAPVTSEYVWNKSNGNDFIMQVADGKLKAYVEDTWYTLATGLTANRWVFSSWYDTANDNNTDTLVMVDGSSNIYNWYGGYATVAEISTTAVKFQGSGSLGLTTSVNAFGTAIANGKITRYINSFSSNKFAGTLVGNSNPSDGEVLSISMNSTTINFTFVSTIGATAGNVLIGATLTDTLNNLVGIFNNPGTTNATQVALSAGNQTVWSTCISTGNAAVVSVLINEGTNQWAQDGFTTGTSSVTINGVTYTVTGGYFIFTNALPISSISGISVGDKVLSVFTTSDQSSFFGSFQPDFCYTIDNQVYYGSYTASTCYVSSSTGFSSFSISTPAVKGSANLIIFDAPLDGITVRNGKPYISVGGNKWGIVNYSYAVISTSNVRQTEIQYTPTSAGSGAFAHEFIDLSGDSVIYLSKDQQVRTFGSFNNSFTSNNYPSFSQEIYTELQNETFSNDTYTGNLRAIGDYIYLTSPISGLTYLYQARQAVNANNQVIVERLWHAPMTWNLTRVDVLNNVVLGFSNSNPQIFELWDTNIFYDEDPSGETFPYISTLKFAYDGGQRRQGLWSFDKVFTEGYIDPNTTLTLTVKYNYDAIEGEATQYVNSDDYPAEIFYVGPVSLGDESYGDSSLGMGGNNPDNDIYKFKTINQFSMVNCFEWQLEYESTLSGSQWEILAKGSNARVESEQDSGFIINQQ